MLILALAGTGKTTFLHALQRRLFNLDLIAVYINLQNVEDCNNLLLNSLIGFNQKEIE